MFDENGEPSEISSSCDEGKGNLDKTFVYKEICGDFKMHVTLDSFDRTSTDKEYFSLLASDSLDFETANFFELRHFSNNNNRLLVSHDSSQEASTTSYWAGDMNNKSVPIDFIIERRGDMIEYWYSVDGGATYEQTSKPRNIIAADAPMYIGAAMTCQSGEVNTAHFKNLTIEGNLVGKDVYMRQEYKNTGAKETGVKLDVEWVSQGDYKEKLNLRMIGSENYDLVFDAPFNKLKTFTAYEMYTPLEDYLASGEYPNLTAAFPENIVDANYYFGHLYGLPMMRTYGNGIDLSLIHISSTRSAYSSSGCT